MSLLALVKRQWSSYYYCYFSCSSCSYHLIFTRLRYLVQDCGSLRPLSLAKKYQASNNITRHNVQVSEELCKKAGHFGICVLQSTAAHIKMC